MGKAARTPLAFRAAWVGLLVVLCAAAAVWGVRIGSSLESGRPVAVIPVPHGSQIPGIVTVNTQLAPFSTATLCAQISPPTSVITVESTTGTVIETVAC